MPNPGTFTGLRGEFLKDQRELYSQAVKDGNINDVVTDIQRRYFKRFPITLRHEEEPTQAWLDQVDDDAPDAELESPSVEGMSPDDVSKALKEQADLMKKLKDRKDSIKRRLHYMYSKDNDSKPSTKLGTGADVVSALTAKILGVDAKLPCLKTPYNVWGPQHREVVDPVFNKRVEDGEVPASQQIALRSTVYKELFDKLPEDEREMWAKAAIREHEKAVREIKKNLEQGASTAPQDRQRVIAALPAILEPIFDLLAEYTGWKLSCIAGGPEPADGGRLNMIMIHSGVIPGTVKADFGRHQHEAFKKSITPSFGSFLKKCYTIDECRSRALPEGFNIRSLSDVDAEGELDLYTFEIDKEHVEASKSHKAKRLFEKEAKRSKSVKPTPPPAGTPSPPLRFGPPIGKHKNRELPSKDKPSNSTKPQHPSPLTSGTSAASSSARPVVSSVPKESIFSQGFDVGDAADIPEQRVLTAEETSALTNAVAAALRGYVSTASLSDPPTPPPSRASPGKETPSKQLEPLPHASQPIDAPAVATSHVPALNSLPPSPIPSRPASPLPSCPASPLSLRPALPLSSQHGSPIPSQHSHLPSRRPTPAPSLSPAAVCNGKSESPAAAASTRPATASPSPQPPAELVGSAMLGVASQAHTPSGAVTVPEFPGVENGALISKKRGARTPSGSTEKRKAQNERGDAPNKKQRTASGSSSSSDINLAFSLDIPCECPPWTRHALELLMREDLGPTWQDLVLAWILFEERSGFAESGGRLGSRGRPVVIANWIKRARNAQYTPDLGDPSIYEATFVAWWNSVQPDWRNAGENAEVGGERSDGDWTTLEGCYGVNGLLSVMAALFFWGTAVSSKGEVTGWRTAVDDVLYVLKQLA